MIEMVERKTVAPALNIPEIDILKVLGFFLVLAHHFWIFETAPLLAGFDQYYSGFGVNANRLQELSWASYLPDFPAHEAIYRLFNIVFSNGYQGVGLFLIISGFGLTLSSLRKKHLETWPYLLGRFERVYLPYLLIMLAMNLFYLVTRQNLSLSWDSLALISQGVRYSWFLFPLVQFYLFFPLLFLLVRSGAVRANTLMGGTIIASFLWSVTVLFVGYNFKLKLISDGVCPPFYFVLFRLAEPVYGMWFAFLFCYYRASFDRLVSLRMLPVYCVLYLAGSYCSLTESNLHLFGFVIPIGQSICNLLISASLFNILFIVSRRFLPWVRHLKAISRYGYEFYLVQSIPLAALPWIYKHLPPNPWNILPILLVILAVNLGIAIIAQSAIQIPCAVPTNRLRNGLIH